MNNKANYSLMEDFSRYFSVELANTPAQKLDVYKIRYRVYCEEFAYESVDDFPDQLETDEYDEISRHCLIIHRESGIPAGCVRMVPAIGNLLEYPLPFEKHCRASLDYQLIDELKLDREKVCEISRFAVDSLFRRRSGEELSRFGVVNAFSLQEQRTFPLLAVAGFMAATVLTERDSRTNVFAVMEPFLPRLWHRSGMNFMKVGSDIDYHGMRAPYFITTESVLINMHDDLRELYQAIKQSLLA